MFTDLTYSIYMYKEDLAFNKLRDWYAIKPNQPKPNKIFTGTLTILMLKWFVLIGFDIHAFICCSIIRYWFEKCWQNFIHIKNASIIFNSNS